MLEERFLQKKLERWNEAYRKGSPLVEDSLYNKTVEKLRKANPNNSFIKTIEPEVINSSSKSIKHSHPMLSTDKAYTPEDLKKFIDRCEAAYKTVSGPDNIEGLMFRITAKLDGVAARSYSDKTAGTRGEDGLSGTAITKFINDIETVGSGFGDGELVIPKEYFDKNLSIDVLGEDLGFAYPRNVMAGMALALDYKPHHLKIMDDKAAHFVLYKDLPNKLMNGLGVIAAADTLLDSFENNTPYLIDGIIIEIVDAATKEYMGATDHHHKWMLAYKRKGETAETIVESVTWQAGRTGVITPVLEIAPVTLSGGKLSRVSGHNVDYMKEHDLGTCALIRVIRSGEVIPKHEETLKSGNVDVPTRCPSCDHLTVIEPPFLWCRNPECSAKKINSMTHFFEMVGNIDLFAEKTIEKILTTFGDSVEDVTDIFELGKPDFIKAGFGERQASNMFEQLDNFYDNPTDDFKFLAALGIPSLGKGDSKNLLRVYSLKDIYTATEDSIESIPQFGALKAEKVYEGLRKVKRIYDYFIDEIDFITTVSLKGVSDSPIKGKAICFTGSMKSGSREDMEASAEQFGAIVKKAVSGATDILVYGANLGASKAKAASTHNVTMYTEEEYLNLIKQ